MAKGGTETLLDQDTLRGNCISSWAADPTNDVRVRVLSSRSVDMDQW